MRPLLLAIADRILEQVAAVRAPSGDLHSQVATLGVFCETVADEVGISDALAVALALSDGPHIADVDVLRFHSGVNGAQLVVGAGDGGAE
eukprot:contig_36784_g8716